jgi:3-deoxy-manno-octulosonate cytidylyltransferase (CMP-KDO synthetase)
MTHVLAIIPARLASTRLPRKVLLNKTGKPLIQHVWEGASACKAISKLVVATDAPEVADAVDYFGGEAVLTSAACQSGTDRVAEAARRYPGYEIVVNVQGDEPEMAQEPLIALIEGMLRLNPVMGTVAVPWPRAVPLSEPGCVKVTTDRQGYALYFSRSPIPYYRDEPNAAPDGLRQDGQPRYWKHVGLYAYQADFLQQYAAMQPTVLEQAEGLEQLRALENGHAIAVFPTTYSGYEVNTLADYEAFVARHQRRDHEPTCQG